jgi:hypothetical protein
MFVGEWNGIIQIDGSSKNLYNFPIVVILLLFCRAWWLMPPDVPQPVRLIVLTLP